MSTLVAIAYPDQHSASEVMGILKRLESEQIAVFEDAVAVIKDAEGKIKLDQSMSLAGVGAASGALWGTLIGLLFFAPLVGLAVGAASGAISGKFSDYGVDDKFAKELGAKMGPGSSALLMLIQRATPDKTLEALKPYGGSVMYTSLPSDVEERLKSALAGV